MLVPKLKGVKNQSGPYPVPKTKQTNESMNAVLNDTRVVEA